MFIFTYTAATLALICTGFAAVVFYKKKQDKLAQFLVLIMIFTACWLSSNSLADIAKTESSLILFSGLAVISGFFLHSFYLCFVEFFIDKSLSLRKKIFYVAPSILAVPFAFSKYSTAAIYFPEGQPAQIEPGILYYFFILFSWFVFIYSINRLRIEHKKSNYQRKAQIAYIQLGFLIMALFGQLFSVILPLFGTIHLFNLGPQFSLFLIVLIAYAIFKHKLFDIKIVIQLGIIYSILLAGIVSVYLAVLYVLLFLLKETDSHIIFLISSLITTIIGIFGVPPIQLYFQKITDKIFFKNKYNYSKSLRRLSEIVSRNINLKDILAKAEDALKDIFKVENVCYLLISENAKLIKHEKFKKIDKKHAKYLAKALSGKKKYIITSEIPYILKNNKRLGEEQTEALDKIEKLCKSRKLEIVIPLFANDKLIGAFSLSKKLSGDAYTDRDIHLLQTFSHQAALALEKSKLYEQVIDHTKNLERRVLERTSEIKELQENQAQVMMDISHGLQTPLTIVKGELDLLQNRIQDTHVFGRLEKSIDRISKFIAAMLNLSRLETEANTDKKEKINISLLLEELLEYFTTLAEQKSISITSEVAKNIFVLGSRNRLEELITNLVSNAVKYIANERKITVTLEKEEKNAVLRISDTGIGIHKEELPNLFKRYYRSEEEHNTIQGTGLGLAICNKIVQNHHGRISITSTLGEGTTVEVMLPLIKR